MILDLNGSIMSPGRGELFAICDGQLLEVRCCADRGPTKTTPSNFILTYNNMDPASSLTIKPTC